MYVLSKNEKSLCMREQCGSGKAKKKLTEHEKSVVNFFITFKHFSFLEELRNIL
jgi:hypothetical protein